MNALMLEGGRFRLTATGEEADIKNPIAPVRLIHHVGPAVCERVAPFQQNTVYCGKSWKALFRCPNCGRETWQNLNFLGSRKVLCDGKKFTKK